MQRILKAPTMDPYLSQLNRYRDGFLAHDVHAERPIPSPDGRLNLLEMLEAQLHNESVAEERARLKRRRRAEQVEFPRFVAAAARASTPSHASRGTSDIAQRRLPHNTRISKCEERSVRAVIVQEYAQRWLGVTPEHRLFEPEGCPCGGMVESVESWGVMSCVVCGRSWEQEQVAVSGGTHDQPNTASHFKLFIYSRQGYLTHLLRNIQGRSNVVVPEEVIEAVRAEMDKKSAQKGVRGVEMALRRITRRRNALKRKAEDGGKTAQAADSLQQYYEASALIWHKISGEKPYRLPRREEEELLRRFQQASTVFDTISTQRKNFLSYSWALHKIARQMDDAGYEMKEFIKLMPAASADRKRENQALWEQICERTGW